MNKDFLHNHPNLEKTLLNTEDEPLFDKDHVIIDKCDWLEAINHINSLKDSILLKKNLNQVHNISPEQYIIPGNVSDEEVKEFHEGIKHDSDKPRFDLIPADALEEVAKVYTVGAKKYGDRNWEKGLSYGRLFGAMLRHAWAWWKGERDDKENKLHHLSSVIFCALGLLHYELNSEKFKKFDDRNLTDIKPDPTPKPSHGAPRSTGY